MAGAAKSVCTNRAVAGRSWSGIEAQFGERPHRLILSVACDAPFAARSCCREGSRRLRQRAPQELSLAEACLCTIAGRWWNLLSRVELPCVPARSTLGGRYLTASQLNRRSAGETQHRAHEILQLRRATSLSLYNLNADLDNKLIAIPHWPIDGVTVSVYGML